MWEARVLKTLPMAVSRARLFLCYDVNISGKPLSRTERNNQDNILI
jgi:hypothetical protein